MSRRLIVMLLLLASAGCGYRAGYTVRRDLRNVSVPVFSNDTFYRNIELDLTREVVTAVEKRTPYRLVDASSPDAVLEGRIKDYRTTVLQADANNAPTEIQLTITVQLTLRAPGGAILYSGSVRDAETYAPGLGSTEAQTWARLSRRAAVRIVETAFEQDW